MAKFSSGKTFAVFQPIAKVFPLNHLLCTVHDGHGLMHCESFPVNSIQCILCTIAKGFPLESFAIYGSNVFIQYSRINVFPEVQIL